MIDTLLHNKERGLSKEKKRTVKKHARCCVCNDTCNSGSRANMKVGYYYAFVY